VSVKKEGVEVDGVRVDDVVEVIRR
jgi:hypothetical protein